VKRVAKGGEPAALLTYRRTQPGATWNAMRDDALDGGQQAYADIRTHTHQDQGGLCAYCEIDIRDNNSLKSRIEHFHPKSDTSDPALNWALDWANMLAVCAGGSYRYGTAPHTLEPLDENLSCDAHKDRLIQQGRLADACEGWVLDPSRLPRWPVSLFALDKLTGMLRANETRCREFDPWPGNHHADMAALVENSIAVLNLNCVRLREARLRVIRDVERNKKRQRDQGFGPHDGLKNLAAHYFRLRWPGFFTTLYLCLGPAADEFIMGLGGNEMNQELVA